MRSRLPLQIAALQFTLASAAYDLAVLTDASLADQSDLAMAATAMTENTPRKKTPSFGILLIEHLKGPRIWVS